jgi:hypothetical protein
MTELAIRRHPDTPLTPLVVLTKVNDSPLYIRLASKSTVTLLQTAATLRHTHYHDNSYKGHF